MKTIKKLIILGVVVLMMKVIVSPAFAHKAGGNREALLKAIVKGADLHLARQGTYSGIDNTWEWQIGTEITGPNVQGISATGLLAAFERTEDEDTDYIGGAVAAGNTLVSRYDATTSRPYSQDVEFLVRLSKDAENPQYASKAATYYERVTTAFTAIQNADRYIDGRKSLAGWDLAAQIRAAVAVGEADYAKGMANRLLERWDDWVNILYNGWDYTIVSFGSLLWALHELDDSDYAATIKSIREHLLSLQETNGSWEEGDYQTTAYISLGLSSVHGKGAKDANHKAWGFLRDSQTLEGGWSYPPEYGEVNSEVLMALGALRLDEGHKVGKSKVGKRDPKPYRGRDLGKHKLDPKP